MVNVMLHIFYHNKNSKEMTPHYKSRQNKNIQKYKSKWLLSIWKEFYLIIKLDD